jgi:hypothetical protein
VIDLIRANTTSDEIFKLWHVAVISQKSSERIRWFEYGHYLGTLAKLSLNELNTILSDEVNNQQHLEFFFKIRRFDYCEMTEKTLSPSYTSYFTQRYCS